jgi:hypothetical protein
MQNTYKYYQDPGHGWIAVKLEELKRLGIARKISGWSYAKGNTVYLEEDGDVSVFIKAKKDRGETFKFESVHTNGRSFVRGLGSYTEGI